MGLDAVNHQKLCRDDKIKVRSSPMFIEIRHIVGPQRGNRVRSQNRTQNRRSWYPREKVKKVF